MTRSLAVTAHGRPGTLGVMPAAAGADDMADVVRKAIS
jgi:hypothetical protein